MEPQSQFLRYIPSYLALNRISVHRRWHHSIRMGKDIRGEDAAWFLSSSFFYSFRKKNTDRRRAGYDLTRIGIVMNQQSRPVQHVAYNIGISHPKYLNAFVGSARFRASEGWTHWPAFDFHSHLIAPYIQERSKSVWPNLEIWVRKN